MAPTRCLLACLILLASTCISWAAIRPWFQIDYSAWHATDIVVATEGEAVDGNLSVLQSWKGQLSPGDALTIEALRSFAEPASRTVDTSRILQKDKGPPIIVSGEIIVSAERMVLFLKRGSSRTAHGRQATLSQWEPASLFGGMNVSVVWVEGDSTYAFSQVISTGPSQLVPQGRSERTMRDRVEEISKIQELLTMVATIPDAAERATMAASYVASDIHLARKEAFRILADCKTSAVSILRQMLAEESNSHQYDSIIDTLAAAGGPELAPEFVRIVEQELRFWKEKAPSLQKGWWAGRGLEWSEVKVLRDQYSKILHVFYALRGMKFEGSRSTVRAFRDVWRTFPQLEDDRGLNQMSKAADAVLNAWDQD